MIFEVIYKNHNNLQSFYFAYEQTMFFAKNLYSGTLIPTALFSISNLTGTDLS